MKKINLLIMSMLLSSQVHGAELPRILAIPYWENIPKITNTAIYNTKKERDDRITSYLMLKHNILPSNPKFDNLFSDMIKFLSKKNCYGLDKSLSVLEKNLNLDIEQMELLIKEQFRLLNSQIENPFFD